MTDCWWLFQEDIFFAQDCHARAYWCGRHNAQGWEGQPCVGSSGPKGGER